MINKIKNNKLLLLIVLLLLVAIVSTFGRFVYNEIKKNFFLTQNFYFESDKLRVNSTLYLVNNYNGVDTYDILINMNSIKNNKIKSTEDISYDITYTCSSNANCSLSKSSGTIYSSSGTDFFILSISPNTLMSDGQFLLVEIVAKSTSPYEKTLKASFKLVVGNFGLSYEILDEENKPYLELKVTNTLDYYKVLEAFNSYIIGDKIDIQTYLGLSEVNKNKCASAIVNLSFDPTLIIYDNVSGISDDIISLGVTNVGGNDYVNALSFKIDAISSKIVRFYKIDATEDYTYPIINPTSIVSVTYTL